MGPCSEKGRYSGGSVKMRLSALGLIQQDWGPIGRGRPDTDKDRGSGEDTQGSQPSTGLGKRPQGNPALPTPDLGPRTSRLQAWEVMSFPMLKPRVPRSCLTHPATMYPGDRQGQPRTVGLVSSSSLRPSPAPGTRQCRPALRRWGLGALRPGL